MQTMQRAVRVRHQRIDRQQARLGDCEILSRGRISAVLRRTARHDHVERIVAAEEKHTDECLVVGERRVAAERCRGHSLRRAAERVSQAAGSGTFEKASTIEAIHNGS
jgi:hypothetical protein